MSRIIISYRRSDSDVFAGRIHDRIASRYGDASVFMDIDDIPFGKDFRQHIQEALAACDAVVAIIGPRWLGPLKSGQTRIQDDTDPIRIEIETALQRRVPIVPVLVAGTKMPKPAHLPATLHDFAFLNAAPVDTGRDFHPHVERLLGELDRILGSKKRAAARDLVSFFRYRAPSSTSRGLRIGFAMAALATLAALGVAMLTQGFSHSPWFLKGVSMASSGRPAFEALKRYLSPVDCRLAKSPVEQTICESEELLTKHRLLKSVYAFLEGRRPSDEQLKSEQLSWRQDLEKCLGEGMYGCISNAHDLRLAVLKKGPSYPCHQDKKRVEQAICKDILLSTKDQVMHDVYTLVVARITVATYKTLRTEQQNWITLVRDACDEPAMVSCIHSAYDSRLIELDRLVHLR